MITFPLLFLQYDKFACAAFIVRHFCPYNFCSMSSLLLLIKHNIPNSPSVKSSQWNNSISINCILVQLRLTKSLSTLIILHATIKKNLFHMLPVNTCCCYCFLMFSSRRQLKSQWDTHMYNLLFLPVSQTDPSKVNLELRNFLWSWTSITFQPFCNIFNTTEASYWCHFYPISFHGSNHMFIDWLENGV